MLADTNYAIAIVTVRMIAGILYFFQGYDKVFNVGLDDIRQTMRAGIGNRKLPDSLITIIALLTSWAELVCGVLLIIGLFKYLAIYILCINLIIIVFGFSVAKPMWENNHVYIRLFLLLILLLTPTEWDILSIDYLIVLLTLNV